MSYGALAEEDVETQSLLNRADDDAAARTTRSYLKNPPFLMLISGAVMLGISTLLVLSSNEGFGSGLHIKSLVTNSSNDASGGPDATNALSVHISRVGYAPLANRPEASTFPAAYNFLSLYSSVIEPYVEMELRIVNSANTSTYAIAICPTEDFIGTNCWNSSIDNNISVDGNNVWLFQLPCTPHQRFDVRIAGYRGTTLISTHQSTAICLYIRREFRSLTTADRDRFLNASHMISQVSEDDGQRMYGPRFHSYGYLAKFHYFNAAWQDADHIHEGNGFLMQHVKITNIFEAAIQSVDPSVCVPYWDFTIESAVNATILSSYVTQMDTYGEAQLPTNAIGYTYTNDSVIDGRIMNGRWHNLKAEMNSHFPDLRTGYGYLRSPWNLNPSPYVSRYTLLRGRPPGHPNFPSCANHFDLLQVNYMMDFFFDMQLLPHGAVHIELGGTFGCETLQPMLRAGYILDEESLWGVCRKWFIILKEGYRANYFLPATDCVVNATDPTLSMCPLTCTPGSEALYYGLFVHVMGNNINTSKTDSQHVWYRFICQHGSCIFTGDHLESASPADPSFWVIHPTLERLLHAKLMTGGFRNESWPADVHKGFVCNKARCYRATTGTKDFHPECCYGHYEHDQMFDGASGNRSVKVGPTNRAVLDATDPRKSTYAMPYIYDSFAWPHCTQDIPALLRAMKVNFTVFTNASSEYQYHIDEEKIQRALRGEF